MKKNIVTLFLLFNIAFQAQIPNSGFEHAIESNHKDWSIKPQENYKIKIDDNVKYSGNNSLNINSQDAKNGSFQSFSQVIKIPGKGLRRLEINSFIKSENTLGSIALWAQVLNNEGEKIDFGNSITQNRKISTNTDWKKYSLDFLVEDDAESFLLGGFLSGSGNVWFDDFNVVEIPFSQKPPSRVASKYINDFEKIVKNNSIFKNKIDWKKLDEDLNKISMGMNTVEDTSPALNLIIKKLRDAGDHHSFIDSKSSVDKKISSNVIDEAPEGKLLDGNIGYIKIPAFTSLNKEVGNSYAKKISDMIKTMDTDNIIKGWIVDLRNNLGGNMYPMIAGVGSLTGEGILGYFVGGQSKYPWKYKNGRIYGIQISEPYHLKNYNNSIAVLIGPKTASSGEATAISFIGKSNVKTFGNPSGGYTSANNIFALSDGKNLLLAVSYEMDRTGKTYTGKITPDVVVEPSKDPEKDADIEAACQWIRNLY